MWTNIFLVIIGLSGGIAVAGGTFSLLVKIGVFTRITEVMRTAADIKFLESAIVTGGIVGNIVSIFNIDVHIGIIVVVVFGLFSGMFVGWLHLALAETLSVFSVGFRRLKLKYGIGCTIFSIGLGKLFGALIYFFNGWGNNM